MLLNLNSRRSGIQTDLCPFIKVRRSMWPLLPWPSIWIHSEMSDTGRAICAPPPLLKSWEGHVSPPSADPRWHVINSEMSDIGRVTCAPPPPPSQTMGGARAPLPIPAFNPFRDVSQAGPPRGVGSIFRLRGHQKCKPQIESRSRNLITKWKYKLKDILKLTPPPPFAKIMCFGHIFCKSLTRYWV